LFCEKGENMALKFRCQKCYADIIVHYLKIGEVTQCSQCGATNTIPADALEIGPSKDIMVGSSTDKYPSMQIISGIYQVLGWILAIALIIIAIVQFAHGMLLIGILYIVSSILILIGYLAIAEGINIFIDIENNTRAIRDSSNDSKRLLEQLLKKEKS
jgi:hypothetical protein